MVSFPYYSHIFRAGFLWEWCGNIFWGVYYSLVGFGMRTYEFPMIKAGVSWRKDLTTLSTHA